MVDLYHQVSHKSTMMCAWLVCDRYMVVPWFCWLVCHGIVMGYYMYIIGHVVIEWLLSDYPIYSCSSHRKTRLFLMKSSPYMLNKAE